MRFTRAFDDTFTSDGGGAPYGALAAFHTSESTLGAPHIGRGGFGFSISGLASPGSESSASAPLGSAPIIPGGADPRAAPPQLVGAPAPESSSGPTEAGPSTELASDGDISEATARSAPSGAASMCQVHALLVSGLLGALGTCLAAWL